MKFLLTILTFLCFVCQDVLAYSFTSVEERHGLADNYVHDIKRDNAGYIWIALQTGIDRFDGYRIKHIPSNGTLPSNPNRIEIDAEDNIWVMTTDSLYLIENEVITNVQNCRALPSEIFRTAYAVVDDNRKGIWVFRTDSLFYRDNQTGNVTGSRMQFRISDADVSEKGIIMLSPEGNVYMRTRNDKQLRRLGTSPTRHTRLKVTADKCMLFDGYQPGASSISLKGPAYKISHVKAVENELIKDISCDQSGAIWFATNENGVHIYSHDGRYPYTIRQNSEPYQISSNHITSLYIDKDLVLVGTSKRGLNIASFNSPKFTTVSTGIESDIAFLHERSDGTLVIGYDGAGLAIYPETGSKTPVRHFTTQTSQIPSNLVIGVSQGISDDIFGTYGGGLFRQEGTSPIQTLDTSDSIRFCRNILTDESGIWCGTFSDGLFKTGIRHYCTENSLLQSNCITGIAKTGDSIYVATSAGLSSVNLSTGNLTRCDVFPDRNTTVSVIYSDSRNLLWAGTHEGFTVLDTELHETARIDTDDGLMPGFIRAITEDRNGNMWFTNASGIACIIVGKGRGIHRKFSIRQFSEKDGIGDISFNKYSIACTPSNRIIAGGFGKYIVLNPEDIAKSSQKYSVFISEVYINGETVSVGKKAKGGRVALPGDIMECRRIDIDYFNSLQLALSTLTFSDAQDIIYEYSIDGLPPVLSTAELLTLGEIPPGKHKLSIRAAGHDDYTYIDIIVHPPFYLSVTAYIIYIVIFILTCLIVYRRIRKKHIKELGEQHTENVLARFENLPVSPDDKFITDAKNIIEKNLDREEFGVEELSEAMGMSRSNLYKKMTAVTGNTPLEFIRCIRMREGRKMLNAGETSISQIAYRVGMSPKQFSKYFKDETGMTPTQYLKRT